MKKHLLSFILAFLGIAMANAEPVVGIVCSYAGQEAFFPLSDSPQVKYENKDGVQHAVVLVGGVEKLSVALVDGGKLEVSYDSRALHEHSYAEAWSNDETNHWHACTGDGECDAPTSGVAAHSYGSVATETAYYTCSVCQYENTTRKAEYEAAVKAAADQAAADAVVEAIDAIGTVEYTEESKALIDAAREAYEALTDDQKALITDDQLQVLTDAETAYADLKAAADQAAADAVVEAIEAIGTVENTEECKALIDAAREAYEALTDDQKALITDDQLQVLTDAETRYADLVAADAAIEAIDAIGDVVFLDECKEKIDAAREAYDALTDDQKAIISAQQYKVLTDAEAAYAALEAAAWKLVNDVIAKIEAIGTVEFTQECKDRIDAARAAYDELFTDNYKSLISAEYLKVLTDAEAAYAELREAALAAAGAVAEKIDAIGTVELTDECKALIDEARAAYDELSDAEKELVENYETLVAAEAEYDRLNDIATGIANVYGVNIKKDGKYYKSGKVIIVKNGKMYTGQGNLIK